MVSSPFSPLPRFGEVALKPGYPPKGGIYCYHNVATGKAVYDFYAQSDCFQQPSPGARPPRRPLQRERDPIHAFEDTYNGRLYLAMSPEWDRNPAAENFTATMLDVYRALIEMAARGQMKQDAIAEGQPFINAMLAVKAREFRSQVIDCHV
jgi:hypothetical protein